MGDVDVLPDDLLNGRLVILAPEGLFCADSGQASPLVCDSAAEAAKIARMHWDLGLASGLLFAAPVPAEAAIAKAQSDQWIAQAFRQAKSDAITGKDVTPYLLARKPAVSRKSTHYPYLPPRDDPSRSVTRSLPGV